MLVLNVLQGDIQRICPISIILYERGYLLPWTVGSVILGRGFEVIKEMKTID